jgi:hypothetical protein
MKLLHNLTWKNIYEARYLLLASAVLAGFLTWLLGNPFAMGAFAGLAVVGGNALRSRYLDALDRRMAAVDGPVWDIELNQVKVGTISDAEYAAIRRKCFTDPRLYVAQVMNALRVSLNAFDYCYRAIPLGLFWVIAALAAFSPDTIATVLAELHKASPDVIQGAVANAARVLVVVMFTVVAMHWMLGLSRFGFIDRFDEAAGTALRKHCKAAAEGSIVLVRWTDGVLHFNDELAHIRPTKNK